MASHSCNTDVTPAHTKQIHNLKCSNQSRNMLYIMEPYTYMCNNYVYALYCNGTTLHDATPYHTMCMYCTTLPYHAVPSAVTVRRLHAVILYTSMHMLYDMNTLGSSTYTSRECDVVYMSYEHIYLLWHKALVLDHAVQSQWCVHVLCYANATCVYVYVCMRVSV